MGIRVSVDRVLGADGFQVLVVVRCLSGQVSVGDLLSCSASFGGISGQVWTVVEMQRYGQVVDLIDQPHTGVLSLISDRPGGLIEGVELVTG